MSIILQYGCGRIAGRQTRAVRLPVRLPEHVGYVIIIISSSSSIYIYIYIYIFIYIAIYIYIYIYKYQDKYDILYCIIV